MKEVIELNQHRLLCGDATNTEDVDLLIGNCKVDLLLTDPPYGIDIVNVERERERAYGRIGGAKPPTFNKEQLEHQPSQASTRRERAVKGKVGKPRHRKTKNVLPNSK
jgi:DNA modification methylase